MICGFVEKNYSVDYKELERDKVVEFCLNNQYFSINSDNEYMIFVHSDIYIEENTDKLMPLIAEINKELLLRSRKTQER